MTLCVYPSISIARIISNFRQRGPLSQILSSHVFPGSSTQFREHRSLAVHAIPFHALAKPLYPVFE
jgi:hypothetical protein